MTSYDVKELVPHLQVRKMSKLTQWLRGFRKRVTKSLVKLSEMEVRIT